jgi:hypothetical protein
MRSEGLALRCGLSSCSLSGLPRAFQADELRPASFFMSMQEKLQIVFVYIPHGLIGLFVIYAFIRPNDMGAKKMNKLPNG